METAVFVDKDLLEHMKTNFPTNTEKEVIQVVLAMVNAVRSESINNYYSFRLYVSNFPGSITV